VKALTHGLNPLPPPDPALRAELETWDLASLVSRLRELDAGAPGLVDTMNKRRVIRAIETCAATGLPLQNARTSWRTPANAAADGLFLTRPRAELHERIRGRVAEMAAAGVLDEVRALAAVPFSATAARIIGLEQRRSCLHGDIDLDTALESIVVATRQYAKRQSTWFRGQSDFPSLDLSGNLTAQRVVEDVLRKMDAAEAQL
jgi:tRNA dimethylallyltransferase